MVLKVAKNEVIMVIIRWIHDRISDKQTGQLLYIGV